VRVSLFPAPYGISVIRIIIVNWTALRGLSRTHRDPEHFVTRRMMLMNAVLTFKGELWCNLTILGKSRFPPQDGRVQYEPYAQFARLSSDDMDFNLMFWSLEDDSDEVAR